MSAVMESLERRYEAIKPHLSERQRRIWLGSEARELGSGGVRVVADEIHAPLVYAGADMTFPAGTAKCSEGTYGYECDECPPITELLGSDATVTDDESDPYDLLWELVSGEATIDDPYALTTLTTMAGFEPEEPSACVESTYTFRLNATDCPQATSNDEVTFTVTCCGVAAP